MKLLFIILCFPLLTFAQSDSQRLPFINLRAFAGVNSVPGPIAGGQFEIGKKHHNFILDYSYSRGDVQKVQDPPEAFQFWTSYTVAKDRSHMILLTYGYANQMSNVRVSANIGPVYEYFIDQKILTHQNSPNAPTNYVVATDYNNFGGIALLQAEHQVGDNFGYGIGLRFGYITDAFAALHFSIAFNY